MKRESCPVSMVLIALLPLVLLGFGCQQKPAAASPEKPSEAEVSQAKSSKIVFIGKQDACDCTRKRVDDAYAELQSALAGHKDITVERLRVDTDPAQVEPYRKLRAIMVLPAMLAVVGVLAWLLLRKTIRTRKKMNKQLHDDQDIHEYLVTFNWTRKVLYIPTVLVSFVACVIMLFQGDAEPSGTLGGIWVAVFFVNFLVDEYEISIKVLIIIILCAVALFLWLHLLTWVDEFVDFFGKLGFQIETMGYLLLGIMFSVAILISWIRGLFYYVAITPNYMNIQIGPTETGEQVSREDYSTRIDTGDFLERLFGFGRIIITFRDQRRQPIVMLVSRIGKLAVDRYQPGPGGGNGDSEI